MKIDVHFTSLCKLHVLWMWNESKLIWIGLTQATDIDECEIQFFADTGTQWCAMLVRIGNGLKLKDDFNIYWVSVVCAWSKPSQRGGQPL